MRLPARMAGIFSSAVFIITIIPVFYQQLNPASPIDDSFSGLELLESMGFSIVGSVVAGIIGFQIGGIMARPKGKKKPKTPPAVPAVAPESDKAATPPAAETSASVSEKPLPSAESTASEAPH